MSRLDSRQPGATAEGVEPARPRSRPGQVEELRTAEKNERPVAPAGRSAPLGATVTEGGVNFSLFARSATGVELLLFDREDDAMPSRVLRIDPATNRTYHYWHVFVPGLRPGQLYGYRVEGPSLPAQGLRFDPTKVLLDPYGRGVVVPKNYDRAGRRAGRRQRGNGDEKRRRRSERLRLGGRRAAEPPGRAHHHLRDARPRVHPPPKLRRQRDRRAARTPA